MVLDELQGHAGIEQVRGDRVPESMEGVAAVETGQVTIPREERLDLTLAKWPFTSSKEWILGSSLRDRGVLPQEHGGHGEERLLGPDPALQAFDHDPAAPEIDVAALKKRHFTDPEAVVVDH